MKKSIAAVLAVLCLVGCSAKEEKAEMIGVSIVTKNEMVQIPAEQEATQEAPVQEFEIEIEEALPEEEDKTFAGGDSVALPEIEVVEGLVGDAVGYSLELPVFGSFYDHADTMNQFYEDLVDGLVDYANGAVNDACLERNCIASVYGKVSHVTLGGSDPIVTYDCVVEYSDSEEPVINTRVDHWDSKTGEVTSEVG